MNADSQSGLRSIVLLVVLCLFSSSVLAQTAQTQEPAKPASEVEQLKQRVQQLEQIVSELKGQINAIEDTKAKIPAPATVIDATYSQPAIPTTSPASPAPQDGKGESTFQIYGFAMLDAGYQFNTNRAVPVTVYICPNCGRFKFMSAMMLGNLEPLEAPAEKTGQESGESQ